MTSILKGRWCNRCNGVGIMKPFKFPETDTRNICPDCKGVGFVGLTAAQVRQAEIDCMKETA